MNIARQRQSAADLSHGHPRGEAQESRRQGQRDERVHAPARDQKVRRAIGDMVGISLGSRQ